MFSSQEEPKEGTTDRPLEDLRILSKASAAWLIKRTADPDILASHLNLLTISACFLLFWKT